MPFITTHNTIEKTGSISGIGMHSGQSCTLTASPSKTEGITFTLKNKTLTVHPDHCSAEHNRATCLTQENLSINTPEHLLSACAALGLTHLNIHLDNPEIPILDGSAKPFIDWLKSLIIYPLKTKNPPIIITAPIIVTEKDKAVLALPCNTPSFSYIYTTDHPLIQTQCSRVNLSEYEESIAPARTFGFEHEIQALKAQGLIQGGALDNALVIGKKNYLNTPRFKNECAKHKILDLIGDCWILNKPIQGHIIGIKSGHELNIKFMQTLYKTFL